MSLTDAGGATSVELPTSGSDPIDDDPVAASHPRWRPPSRPVTEAELMAKPPVFVRFLALVLPVYIAATAVAAFTEQTSVVGQVVTVVGAVVMVSMFVFVVIGRRRDPAFQRASSEILWLFVAISVVMTLVSSTLWAGMLVPASAAIGFRFSGRRGARGVLICTVLVVVLMTIRGAEVDTTVSVAIQALLFGLLTNSFGQTLRANAALVDAQEEIARLAVADERLRFSRDLHDLLGHSLSVVALKSELARRLVDDDPQRAGREMAEVEEVARRALQEVREAVTGYRQPTLSAELANARAALEDAGLVVTVDEDEVVLPTPIEAALAWAVREGTTNVLRHSGASRCQLRVANRDGAAVAEVVDDGRGPAPVLDDGGHGDRPPDERWADGVSMPSAWGGGLAGLAERVAAVGGTVETGLVDRRGHRLVVRIPLVR